jgi:heat shock protein HtpX
MAFFIGLNIVVVLTISIIISVLGIHPYLTNAGMDYGSLMAFCLVWGMGGAFISLLLSKIIVKWTMGVKVIDPSTSDPDARFVLDTVYRLARTGGLTKMPEVGIYNSPEVNAFATGPTKNRALVAVSSGLLRSMDHNSVEGVLGHELTHVLNGDMVTMTLIQGVVNAFVMALARVIAFAIDNALRGDRNNRGGGLGRFGYMITVWVLEMVLFIPGSMIVAWFSRGREFRADQGGARLAGREKMIGALRALQRVSELPLSQQAPDQPQSVAALKISSGARTSTFGLLRASHPPLAERIARLERGGF